MNFSSSSKYRDQGVYVDFQSVDGQPGVGTEREEEQLGRDVEEAYGVSRGMRRDVGSQALPSSSSSAAASTSNSKSGTFMSPYGDYDMDDSSFFAHTTRLNIVGPNASFTQFVRRRSLSPKTLLFKDGKVSIDTSSFHKPTIRSRSPSPSLVPEKKRTSPTEPYLQQSLQSSLPLEDPTASRKLLVLDLNGTLLLRSTHSGRRGPTPFPNKPLPALRTVYPRPYIPSFCAYIFHPTTLQWLDTMVWSSAQPHSVNDMVDKCFGRYKEGLKAVWARDTLGLSTDEYHKKTQTTKDLAKPWAHIPSLLPNQSPPDSEVDAADEDNHPSIPQRQQQQHSALTTILMDDSPLKAVLQPWNHLCVSEYGSERRKLDVEIAERELKRSWLAERELERTWQAERELERTWLAEREQLERTSPAERELELTRPPAERELECAWPPERKLERTWLAEREHERTWQAEREHAKENVEEEEEERTTRDGTTTDRDLAAVKSSEETTTEGVDDKGEERKRKRKEKKLLKREKLLLAKEQQLEEGVEEEEEERYDELMLAVIGILDALKHEGNVAGWMRSGGLVHVVGGGGGGDQDTISETTPETPVTTTTTSIPTLSSMLDEVQTPRSKRDSSTLSIEEGPSKRRRLELDSDSETVVLPTTPTTTKRRRSLSMSSVPSSSPLLLHSSPPHSSPSSSSPLLFSAQAEQALTGVPLSTDASSTTTTTTTFENKTSGDNKNSSVSTQTETETQQQPLLWYETPHVLTHWAQRGREALAELGIDVIHGVVPPNQNGLADTGGGRIIFW